MKKATMRISGMHCVSCAQNIERTLKKLKGVSYAGVNFASENATVEFDGSLVDEEQIKKSIRDIGYDVAGPGHEHHMEGMIHGVSHEAHETSHDAGVHEHDHHGEKEKLWKRFVISAILSVPLLYSMLASFFSLPMPLGDKVMALVEFLLATGALVAGSGFFSRGIIALRKTRSANMDTLVALGTGSAYIYSVVVTILIFVGRASA